MNKESCMVSILCTAYNHEAYIAQALESFVNQKTDFAFEVLVNDDCSKDNTAGIIREYAQRYPQIIRPFYQQKNLFSQIKMPGLFDTVFRPEIRGKYVALCEGDDYWSDMTKLKRQVDFLENNPEYSACVHNTTLHYCGGEAADRALIAPGEDRDVEYENVVTGMSRAFHTSSILMRSEYIINPPDFYYTAGQYGFTDYAIGLWLTLKGRVRFLEREMSVYRISSGADSWSSNQDGYYKKRLEFVRGEEQMLKTMLPHLNAQQLPAAQEEILKREYELLYLTGDAGAMLKEPYRRLFRQHPFKYRLKIYLKYVFPSLHEIYRKKRGFKD